MYKYILRFFIISITVALCCGCARVAPDPQIPYGLLIKCRDLLAFCVFLVDQDKPYYNNIAQRYYYAMLTLASITFQWNRGHGWRYLVIKHSEVWELMPHDVKKLYGRDLKDLRTRCDYHFEEEARDMESYKKELSMISSEGEKVFPHLDRKIRADYAKFFGENGLIRVSDCDSVMEEIEDLHEGLRKKLIVN